MNRGILALALLGLAAEAGEISLQRQSELMNLLQQDCGSCHGLRRQGGLGLPLLPETLAAKPDDVLMDAILNGRPGTAMPPWRGFMSPDEARWLVARLRQSQP